MDINVVMNESKWFAVAGAIRRRLAELRTIPHHSDAEHMEFKLLISALSQINR